MLQCITWEIRTIVNMNSKYSPGQLAFSHDMILPLKINYYWDAIVTRRQSQTVNDNTEKIVTVSAINIQLET